MAPLSVRPLELAPSETQSGQLEITELGLGTSHVDGGGGGGGSRRHHHILRLIKRKRGSLLMLNGRSFSNHVSRSLCSKVDGCLALGTGHQLASCNSMPEDHYIAGVVDLEMGK